MRIFKLLSVSSLFFSMILLSGCSLFGDEDDGPEFDYESEWYDAAQENLRNEQWDFAIKKLQSLEEQFPFGTYAEQAQLELIYAYYMTNEPESSTAAANRFIRLHPQHRNVDYAYYMKGLASFTEGKGLFERYLPTDLTMRDPGAARESFAHFAQLLARFPDSSYAPDAKKRMLYLRNVLARYEIHVANYYFKRGTYVAAVNRGRYVVENFPETPAIPDALAVMIQGYDFLNMPEQAEKSLKTLRLNYPDHPALNKDGSFDYDLSAYTDRSWVNTLTLGIFDKKEPPGFDTRELYNNEYKK